MSTQLVNLQLSTKNEEVRIISGNDEVSSVIEGIALTKIFRKKTKNKRVRAEWIQSTSERYIRYIDFLDEERKEFKSICYNIDIVNRFFWEGTMSIENISKLVYKIDKQFIKFFKEWEMIN